jgi:glycosyltransferase involved in cell wall biosynthesis
MISRADIIILPYLRERYPFRTSGVFIDALIHEKVVVVPEGTWMEEMIIRHGSGATFRSGDAKSLIEAIESVIENYALHAEYSSRNVTDIYSQFSAEALLDLIFGN